MKNVPFIARKKYFDELVRKLQLLISAYKSEDNYNNNCFNFYKRDIMSSLDDIFSGNMDEAKCCIDIIFNEESDKIPFGIIVDPVVSIIDLKDILFSEKEKSINNYRVEIDIKILDILNSLELATYILQEVVSITGKNIIEKIREIISILSTKGMDNIDLCYLTKISSSSLLIFGIRTVMSELCLLTNEQFEPLSNPMIEAFDLKDIIFDVYKKMRYCLASDITTDYELKISILSWVLSNYKNIDENYNTIIETLKEAKESTSSIMRKEQAENLICIISNIDDKCIDISETVFQESSFFTKIKRNGLKQIEDDLYEFKVRSKNCETQDEAIYIIRQINSRLSILDDYIMNENISDYEKDRWMDVIYKFRDLRDEIGKKKISNKKSYGIFVDYDKIDQYDM